MLTVQCVHWSRRQLSVLCLVTHQHTLGRLEILMWTKLAIGFRLSIADQQIRWAPSIQLVTICHLNTLDKISFSPWWVQTTGLQRQIVNNDVRYKPPINYSLQMKQIVNNDVRNSSWTKNVITSIMIHYINFLCYHSSLTVAMACAATWSLVYTYKYSIVILGYLPIRSPRLVIHISLPLLWYRNWFL